MAKQTTIKSLKQKLKKQLGQISENDQYHFELLVSSWQIYLTAEAEILANGITIKTAQRIFINPAVTVRNEAWKQIKNLSELFGIKPISRAEASAKDDEDDIADLL